MRRYFPLVMLLLAVLACGDLPGAGPGPTETAAAAALTTAREEWSTLVFVDDFDGPPLGGDWGDTSPVDNRFGQMTTTRADGRFTMEAHADDGVIWWNVPTVEAMPAPPYLIEASIPDLDLSDLGGFGLIFWRENSANYTAFYYYPASDRFVVERINNEAWTSLVTLSDFEAVIAGGPLTMSVLVGEGYADLFVNGRWVETITAVGTYGDAFGLMLTHAEGTESAVSYESIRVMAP